MTMKKTTQMKVALGATALLLTQVGCTLFGGPKSSQVVTSKGVLPPDTKMVDFSVNVGPVNGTLTTGQKFVFDISCPNVYQIAGLPSGSPSLGATWHSTVTIIANNPAGSEQLNVPEFANGNYITCTATLNSMEGLDGGTTIYTPGTLYPKLTLILNPTTDAMAAPTGLALPLVKNTGMMSPNNYTNIFPYTNGTSATDSYYVTGGYVIGSASAPSISCAITTTVSATCTRNYTIGFVYSKTAIEAQNYTKNPAVSASFDITEDPALPTPSDPQLNLVQYPSDVTTGVFRYRLFGKAFLSNPNPTPVSYVTTDEQTNIDSYFNPGGTLLINGGTSDGTEAPDPAGPFALNATADSLYNGTGSEGIISILYQFFHGFIMSGQTVDKFSNIVKNANACKMFVVADGVAADTPAWYTFSTVASSALPTGTPTSTDKFIWTDATVQSSNGVGTSKDFPYKAQIDSTTPTLSIQNLNALMTVPSAGSNGVYDCMDIRDYYGQDPSATPPASADYTAAVGTSAKVLINNYMLDAADFIPATSVASNSAIVPPKTQFYNWGIDDSSAFASGTIATNYPAFGTGITVASTSGPIAMDTAKKPSNIITGALSGVNYPQFNKNKVLVVYRNQQTVSSITKNAYRYVIVNALTAAP